MNNLFVLLGIGAQLPFSLHYSHQAYCQRIHRRTCLGCLAKAFVYGLFGLLMLYGWLQLGLTPVKSTRSLVIKSLPARSKTGSLSVSR